MESGLYSRAYLQNQMAVALGGRVAEEIIYGEDEVTTGASNDLQQVAQVARQMITRFGMSDKLGPVALGRSQGGMFLGRDIAAERDFSEDTASTIDQEVYDLVDVAYKRATQVLVDNRSVLDELADLLVEKETVDAEELQELSGVIVLDVTGVNKPYAGLDKVTVSGNVDDRNANRLDLTLAGNPHIVFMAAAG